MEAHPPISTQPIVPIETTTPPQVPPQTPLSHIPPTSIPPIPTIHTETISNGTPTPTPTSETAPPIPPSSIQAPTKSRFTVQSVPSALAPAISPETTLQSGQSVVVPPLSGVSSQAQPIPSVHAGSASANSTISSSVPSSAHSTMPSRPSPPSGTISSTLSNTDTTSSSLKSHLEPTSTLEHLASELRKVSGVPEGVQLEQHGHLQASQAGMSMAVSAPILQQLQHQQHGPTTSLAATIHPGTAAAVSTMVRVGWD